MSDYQIVDSTKPEKAGTKNRNSPLLEKILLRGCGTKYADFDYTGTSGRKTTRDSVKFPLSGRVILQTIRNLREIPRSL